MIKDFLERRQICKPFSKYISKEANKSNDHSISYTIVNIIDYVALAEELALQDLCNLLVNYVHHVETIVSRNHGTIEKILGDHVSAYWIHPDASNLKTDSAILAAHEIINSKGELHPRLDLSIGIATGKALWLGEIYVGTVCNNAIRLLEMSKTSRNRIVVCETTNSHQDIFNTKEVVDKLSPIHQGLKTKAYEIDSLRKLP